MPRRVAGSIVCEVKRRSQSRTAAHVVVAGGGFAAVETLLALRALAGDRVRVTLVSPDPAFVYRPAATMEAFDESPPRFYDLRAIATDLGATFHRARLEAVGSDRGYVRLSSGSRFEYDALVLAVGARAVATIPGAQMFRDQRDVPMLRRLLEEIEAGTLRRLAFAVPAGCSWPVAIYELALLSAAHAAKHDASTKVTIVTPERAPLEIFGREPSRLVQGALAERGVAFVGDSPASAVLRDGSLELASGDTIEADRVVAGPQLRGRWINGVPGSWWGFIPTDSVGRVEDMPDVYAAGDVTTFPVKQAGLAAQQADLIAHTIASEVGAELVRPCVRRVLQARLVGGPRPLILRAELDQHGRATMATLVRVAPGDPPARQKVFARYLTPYLELHEPPLVRLTA
jgi:sulfide:quinone oxidoreductase